MISTLDGLKNISLRSHLLASFALAATVFSSQADGAGFVPVSRNSYYNSVGHYSYFWDAPMVPPTNYHWDMHESTTQFGSWSASPPYSYAGMSWHVSVATTTKASFIAQTAIGSYFGNHYSYTDNQTTGFEYVFDVVAPTSIKAFGDGAKLTSTNGFLLTFNGQSNQTPYEVVLQPGRYTMRDTFINGHGFAHAEINAIICASDFNSDALVDDADFQIFISSYTIMLCSESAMPAGCPSDLNADGVVDDSDFQLFGQAYDDLLCP